MIKNLSKLEIVKKKLSFLPSDYFEDWLIAPNSINNKTPLELIESELWEDGQTLETLIYYVEKGIE